MMAYLCNRAGIFAAPITDQEASELYAEASKHTASALRGDLETGFTFWTLSLIHEGLRLVHIYVEPLREDQGHQEQAATASEIWRRSASRRRPPVG